MTISLQKLSKNAQWATLFLATDAAAARPPPASGSKKMMQCLHDYEATDPLELSFHEGDVIVVIQENNTGWWKGELDGVVGLFPSNFTEELSASAPVAAEYNDELDELDDATANVVAPAAPAAAAKPAVKPAAPPASANAAAAAAPPTTGAKPPPGAVAVMRPVMGPGTGTAGAKPAPLKSPSAYTPSATAQASPTAAAAPPAPFGKPAPLSAAPPKAAAPTPGSGAGRAVAVTATAKGAARPGLENSASSEADGRQQVRAMYNFVGTERGELSLRENDVVVVLKRDESGWWQGQVTYTGWFPASFVEDITD